MTLTLIDFCLKIAPKGIPVHLYRLVSDLEIVLVSQTLKQHSYIISDHNWLRADK